MEDEDEWEGPRVERSSDADLPTHMRKPHTLGPLPMADPQGPHLPHPAVSDSDGPGSRAALPAVAAAAFLTRHVGLDAGTSTPQPAASQPRRRGRPKGSKTNPKTLEQFMVALDEPVHVEPPSSAAQVGADARREELTAKRRRLERVREKVRRERGRVG